MDNAKYHFIAFSIRKKVIPAIFILFIIFLVVFSNSNLTAAKNGLKLWANNVVPALLPFFIATELLSYTDISKKISIIFSNIMKPLFNVPGNAAYAFILGLISGYPVGAKIVTDFRNSNLCTQDEGNRMLAFTNNSSPLFIIGTVGISLFRCSTIGILLLVTHILSAISVGIILGVISKLSNQPKVSSTSYCKMKTEKYCTISNLGEVLSNCIMSSIKTVLMIGGFIVIFSVIISILNTSGFFTLLSYVFCPIFNFFNIDISFIRAIFTGLVELTNGVSLVSNIPSKILSTNIIICSFLLGFGGISVLLQILSIVSKSDLSIKTYIYGKLLQGIIAALYTYIFISNFTFLNFNL